MFIVSIDSIFIILLAVAIAIFLFFWIISKVNEWRFRYKPESGHLFRCPICSRRLKAARAGRFRCPECTTILALAETGAVNLG